MSCKETQCFCSYSECLLCFVGNLPIKLRFAPPPGLELPDRPIPSVSDLLGGFPEHFDLTLADHIVDNDKKGMKGKGKGKDKAKGKGRGKGPVGGQSLNFV